MLSDFPVSELYETIPDFHNTPLRFENFCAALKEDKAGRAASAKKEIDFILERKDICSVITDAVVNGLVPVRVAHNDTKYNNLLFDDITGKAICVIDLDTVMPGSLLYDYGDSLRSGASSEAEDETELAGVFFSLDLFSEFTRGYIEELKTALTDKERELLPFSAQLMTFECAMRFLTDYLCGDTYFKTRHPLHNLERARCQLALAADIEKKLPEMADIVNRFKPK